MSIEHAVAYVNRRLARAGYPAKQAALCTRCGSKLHQVDKCPIPPDFDREQERRRTKQGGCCGSPKNAT